MIAMIYFKMLFRSIHFKLSLVECHKVHILNQLESWTGLCLMTSMLSLNL